MDRKDHPRHDSWFSAGDLWRLRTLSTSGPIAEKSRTSPAPQRTRLMRRALRITLPSCLARSGGGRSFQHRDAANLKGPRNAAVRCLGVENV
ncbi:hypothetical protein ABMA28_004175 [Loxostege sticticalis]|uniref:Uncharacterized protein n=1 Tax=Loxostege sticticalis TaxID=481309 RepID=A0ABD0SUI4_LOXSC